MLRRGGLALVLLALAFPAGAGAVTVRATTDPGGGLLVTVTGTAGAERIVASTAPSNDPARGDLLLSVPAAGLVQSGCNVRAGSVTSTLGCPTQGRGRLVVRLDDGADALEVQGVATALGGAGVLVDADGGDGSDRLTVAAGLAAAGASVTPVASVAPVRLRGGFGSDMLSSASQALLDGGAGGDSLTGSAADDSLDGGLDGDRLLGGPGADTLAGGAGGDDVDGGPGLDLHSYAEGPPVTVTLDDACDDGAAQDTRPPTFVQRGDPGECQNNGVDRDRLLGIETVVGTAGADSIVGSGFDERLFGGGGNDLIEGGGGSDELVGEAGVDTLLARDGVVDARIVCGDQSPVPVTGPDGRSVLPLPTPGDRAVVDADDVVGASCDIVERGGGRGPAENAPPPAPPAAGVASRPAAPSGPPTGRAEPGAGPGGGLPGKAPQLRLLSRTATPDARGRLALQLACVYLARECVGTVTLTAPREVRAVQRRTVRRGGRTRTVRRVLRIRRGTVLGRATTTIPWGRSARVRVALTPRFRALLAASGRAGVTGRLVVRIRDGAQPTGVPATLTAALRVGRRAR